MFTFLFGFVCGVFSTIFTVALTSAASNKYPDDFD